MSSEHDAHLRRIKNRKLLNLILMFQHGSILMMWGVLVPEIMDTFGVTEAATGVLLGVGTLGAIFGPLVGGPSVDRVGIKRVLLIGYLAEIFFLLLFGVSGVFWLLVVASFVVHIGAGFVEIAGNVLPNQMGLKRINSFMNLVHFAFSLSAFITPILLGAYIETTGNWRPLLGFLAVPPALMLVFALLHRFDRGERDVPEHQRQPASENANMLTFLKEPAVVLGALSLCLYVGSEVGLSAWIVYYLRSSAGFAPVQAAAGLTLLWGGIMVGRFGNTFLSRHLASFRLVAITATTASAAAVLMLQFEALYAVYLCIFIIGLSLSGIFPNIMAEINHRFPRRIGTVTAFMTVGAALGAVLFQWVIGFAAELTSISFALYIPPILLLVLLYVFPVGVRRKLKHSSPTAGLEGDE